MNSTKYWVLLIAASLALQSPAIAGTIIDFEDWAGGGDVQASIESQGYSFHSGFVVSVEPETGNATYALHGLLSDAKFRNGGGSFGIISLDLQEGLGVTDTISIQLKGYRATLPPVTQTFVLDGSPNTFETFYPIDFVEVTSVYLYAYDSQGQPSQGFSVDNIVVPEPAALALMVLSLGASARRRARI